MPTRPDPSASQHAVRAYWERHIHDLDITRHPPGSAGFFADLEQYHFEKLHHLPALVPFGEFRGRRILEVGCGAGTDLIRFARSGAIPTGVDLAESSIKLASSNFSLEGRAADLLVADGEALPFHDKSFDLVSHGVVQYHRRSCLVASADACSSREGQSVSGLQPHLVVERVVSRHQGRLRHVMRRSWKYSIGEFRDLLKDFSRVRIVPERFPVKTRLHGGLKAALYNTCFVGLFNAMPRPLVRQFGWHLLAFCEA